MSDKYCNEIRFVLISKITLAKVDLLTALNAIFAYYTIFYREVEK